MWLSVSVMCGKLFSQKSDLIVDIVNVFTVEFLNRLLQSYCIHCVEHVLVGQTKCVACGRIRRITVDLKHFTCCCCCAAVQTLQHRPAGDIKLPVLRTKTAFPYSEGTAWGQALRLFCALFRWKTRSFFPRNTNSYSEGCQNWLCINHRGGILRT